MFSHSDTRRLKTFKYFTGVMYNCYEQYHEITEMIYIKVGSTRNMSVDKKHIFIVKISTYLYHFLPKLCHSNTTKFTEIIHYISVICANI